MPPPYAHQRPRFSPLLFVMGLLGLRAPARAAEHPRRMGIPDHTKGFGPATCEAVSPPVIPTGAFFCGADGPPCHRHAHVRDRYSLSYDSQ